LPSDFNIGMTELYAGEFDQLILPPGAACEVRLGHHRRTDANAPCSVFAATDQPHAALWRIFARWSVMHSSSNQSEHHGVLQRMMRRIQLMASWGRVTFSDDSKTAQLLQVKLNDTETRDGTPRIAEFGFTSRPPEGSDVLVVFLGGDRSKGVVVATGHQASRPINLLAGESMLYDLQGKSIHLTASDGIVVKAQEAPLTVNNATTVAVNASEKTQFNTPLLKVSGPGGVGGVVNVGTGATGSFSTPTGQTVMVQEGIITNIF
jgi:phage baseplate assembly protein V